VLQSIYADDMQVGAASLQPGPSLVPAQPAPLLVPMPPWQGCAPRRLLEGSATVGTGACICCIGAH
jgi:hypothetical protein